VFQLLSQEKIPSLGTYNILFILPTLVMGSLNIQPLGVWMLQWTQIQLKLDVQKLLKISQFEFIYFEIF
jgi:hypothetical protein